mmetsp:Transcript_6230/g.9576  ORF Transcript_6230/g.9576 Transcript_6230/m.9576 type:complete len:155 (-) Transcript_6230:206-670(-)
MEHQSVVAVASSIMVLMHIKKHSGILDHSVGTDGIRTLYLENFTGLIRCIPSISLNGKNTDVIEISGQDKSVVVSDSSDDSEVDGTTSSRNKSNGNALSTILTEAKLVAAEAEMTLCYGGMNKQELTALCEERNLAQGNKSAMIPLLLEWEYNK